MFRNLFDKSSVPDMLAGSGITVHSLYSFLLYCGLYGPNLQSEVQS